MSAGALAAIASSLCCIGPLVAILGGAGGAASTFSWIEPARPYLIGFSALALGLAFWQAYKPKAADDCGCELPEKKKFFQTKSFLWVITVFSILMFSFPYYSHIFFNNSSSGMSMNDEVIKTSIHFEIDGMTCEACEEHVVRAIYMSDGVYSASASYEDGTANSIFDASKTNKNELSSLIENETGYKVAATTQTEYLDE